MIKGAIANNVNAIAPLVLKVRFPMAYMCFLSDAIIDIVNNLLGNVGFFKIVNKRSRKTF